MLKKAKRIKKSLFSKAYQTGRVFSSPNMTIRVSPIIPNEDSKFSFVVSKAVAKSAVDRNLLRRRGYASLSGMSNLPEKGSANIFFFKKGAKNLSYKALSGEILELLNRTRDIRK